MQLHASCLESWWEVSFETAIQVYNRTPLRRTNWSVFDNSVFDRISFGMEQAYCKRKVLLVDSYYYSYFVPAIVGIENRHEDWFQQSVPIYLIFWLVISSILPVILVLQILQLRYLQHDWQEW